MKMIGGSIAGATAYLSVRKVTKRAVEAGSLLDKFSAKLHPRSASVELWSVQSPLIKDYQNFVTLLPQSYFGCSIWEKRLKFERWFLRREYDLEVHKPHEMPFRIGDTCPDPWDWRVE